MARKQTRIERSTRWGALHRQHLKTFFKIVKKTVSARGSNHSHVVQIEPQRVSTLAVYRAVHEKPLSADQVNALKKAAFAAGISGQFRGVQAAEGRTGSMEFRFDGKDADLIHAAFVSAHGRKTNRDNKSGNLRAEYRFA